MKTPTEWLFEKLWDEPKDKLTWYALLEQAKQMERKEIETLIKVALDALQFREQFNNFKSKSE